MQDKQAIFEQIRDILAEEFELDPETITRQSHLYQELGLDSIDAVDLIVKVQELVGRKIDPETFRQVRTVDDVIEAIEALLARK